MNSKSKTDRAALARPSAVESPTTGAWPSPDMTVLNTVAIPAPPFPIKVFGRWAKWLTVAAESAEAPVDYTAGALLAAEAGLIGNSRRVQARPDWIESCILWTGGVGAPATRKTSAIRPVLDGLRRVEEKVIIPAGNNDACLVVSDTTLAATTHAMASNPMGLILVRDELAGWFGTIQNDAQFRPFSLEAYQGGRYIVRRKITGGTFTIPQLTISIIGGIQPSRLATLVLSGDDDGMAGRFVWFWPDPVPLREPTGLIDDAFIDHAFRRLALLRVGPPRTVPLSDAAYTRFSAWRRDHLTQLADKAGMLASAWGKMDGLALRMALTFHYAAWATLPDGESEPQEIEAATMDAAITFVKDYVAPMAERVYGSAIVPADESDATKLARYLMRERPDRINTREVRRSAGLPGMREARPFNAAVAVLVEANWLRPDGVSTGGRKTSDYLVNPRVYAKNPVKAVKRAERPPTKNPTAKGGGRGPTGRA